MPRSSRNLSCSSAVRLGMAAQEVSLWSARGSTREGHSTVSGRIRLNGDTAIDEAASLSALVTYDRGVAEGAILCGLETAAPTQAL